MELNQNHSTSTHADQINNDSSSSGLHGNADSLLKGIKLEIPKISGSDVLGWVFKVEQFFTFHEVREEQRITISSFALEGDALQWYQWMHVNKQVTSWSKFVEALQNRFVPSAYEDVQVFFLNWSKLLQWPLISLNLKPFLIAQLVYPNPSYSVVSFPV